MAVMGLLIVLMSSRTLAESVVSTENGSGLPSPNGQNILALPEELTPLVVRIRFDLHDINDVNDEAETFEFTGVVTLQWNDPRQAFDPAVEGVEEKILTGNFQFNEVSPSWYPQLVLVNEAGMFQKSGVLVRTQPDGTSTLIETVNAVAETKLDMRRFPFDEQRLEANFNVLGFDSDEVLLEVESSKPNPLHQGIRVPQWDVAAINGSVRNRLAPYAGDKGVTDDFVLSIDLQRKSFYTIRLVVIPLVIIVLLSFSVFWMDRSSLGDRLNISFIGILTAVAYLMVTSDQLPRIAYFTLVHGFLNLSLLAMCATVLINLIVGALDKRGEVDLGDRVDRACRWGFPITFFGLLLIMVAAAFVYF